MAQKVATMDTMKSQQKTSFPAKIPTVMSRSRISDKEGNSSKLCVSIPYVKITDFSTITLFADDAVLYSVIASDEEDDQLQDYLRQPEIWQSKWHMVFNPSTCKTISISTKKAPPQKKYVFCGVK